MTEIIEFNYSYLEEAGSLLYRNQKKVTDLLCLKSELTKKQCISLIEEEMKKNVSSSLMLLNDGILVGYVIAIIKEDSIWGRKGWIDLSGWALDSDFLDQLGFLYQIVGQKWIEENIYQHFFMTYAFNHPGLDIFNELGFAREQAHAILQTDANFSESDIDLKDFTVRKALLKDQLQLNTFSRNIALYQSQSPCFASAPDEYLTKLDEGFSTLVDDDEGDLYVIEKNGKIYGFQLYYKEDYTDLLKPEGCVELAVSAVSEDSRGLGIGKTLTIKSLEDQIDKGYKIFVTDWRCANLLSSRFWPKFGFQPIAYRLIRRIDPMVSLKRDRA